MSGCLSVTALIACPTQSARSCGQCKLEWSATLSHELPGQRFGDQPSERCSRGDASHATSPLLQRSHRCQRECTENAMGDISSGKIFCSGCEEQETFSVIPQDISKEQPPGPGEEPDGAPLRLVANSFRSNCTGASGWKLSTSPGISLNCSPVAQFVQSGLVFWDQLGTCEFMPGT